MADAAKSDTKSTHATALAQFKFVAETEGPQRKRELEALKFQSGDHWPEEAKASREGSPASAATGNVAVPARPMLVMRTLDQPIAQIVNSERDADLAVTIVPKDGKANDKTAEVYAGLVRAIQVDSHADDVYSWGFQRMVGCGRGYWRVNKAFADERGGIDQVLRIEPIENGFSVYLDPLPKWQPNGGFWEGEYAFITQDVPEADYLRDYGESKLASASDSELLEGLGDDRKHWVLEGEAGKSFRIAEYFYACYEPETTPDGRTIQVRRIKWAKMNGVEWLDAPQEWDGQFIPIVEDTGNKFNIGGTKIIEGVTQPAMSPGLMLDYMVSAAAEKIGLASVAPWLAVAGQIQGYEAWWNQANTRNFPVLEYNATTAGTGSQILPPPTRNNDEPAIQAFAEMIGLFTNFIRSTTGVPDAALGHTNPNDRSGKAIEELKIASQQGTSGWLMNHGRAIRQTGIILVDLIPHIYDRPGRVERTLAQDGTESSVMLNQPFVRDESGQPQPVQQPGMMARMGQSMGMMKQPQPPELHNLAEGRYGVIVNVGKGRDSQRQEDLAGMNALAQAAPEMVPRFADLWVLSMGLKNSEQIAARIKPPGVEDGEADPQQLMAENAQLKQAMQELQQLADDNQAKVAIADKKNQADLAKTQMTEAAKAQTTSQSDHVRLEIAAIQSQTALAVAEMKAGQDETKAILQLMLKKMDIAHDTHMHVVSAREDADGRIADHELGSHAEQASHERALELQDRDHEHQVVTAQIPPPKDPNKSVGAE